MAKINELREQLVELGKSQDEVDKMGKKELNELLLQLAADNAKDILDTAVSNQQASSQSNGQEKPEIGSQKWTDYIISLCDKGELENGMPKVDALRRVAYGEFGLFSIETDVIQVPMPENNYRSTVVVKLLLPNGRTIFGAADVFSGNTEKKFANHSVATAETRAEGRALRRALGLTKILSAEELKDADADENDGTNGKIVSSMLQGLRIMCNRLNVDLEGIVKVMSYNVQSLEDLTRQQGIEISNKLTSYQTGKEQIPEQVKI